MAAAFLMGDLVLHRDEAHPRRLGFVTGYTGFGTMIRVQTDDYRHRIWAKKNAYKLDDDIEFFHSIFPEDLQRKRLAICAAVDA